MVASRWRRVVVGGMILGAGWGSVGLAAWGQSVPDGPPALEAPVGGDELMPATATPPASAKPATEVPLHEVFLPSGTVSARVHSSKPPPSPIIERPTANRPGPLASWVPGYWAWSQSGDDFVWVSGTWRVPPRDQVWVNGQWVRDAKGWARVPGSWSPRLSETAAVDRSLERAVAVRPAWRTTGPPADPPGEAPGPAPDADAFYVPGHYAPDGDRLTWKPGFWTSSQPGWDWVPSRWVRRPDGWNFRLGYWARDPGSADLRRYSVARPAAGNESADLPPAIADLEPAAGSDHLPPKDASTEHDPIAENEGAGGPRDRAPSGPNGVATGPTDPRTGQPLSPYPMNRPPGPYGPGAAPRSRTGRPNRRGGGRLLPPFARWLLNPNRGRP